MALIRAFLELLPRAQGNATNSTVVQYIAWQSEPDGRGTYGLVTSCLSTLLLCVYSCLHPNLPPPIFSRWDRLSEKIWLIVEGIIAPEFVFSVAIDDWWGARAMVKTSVKEANKLPNSESWTMTQAYFATMGGYTVDLKTCPEDCMFGFRSLFPETAIALLTPFGVTVFMRLGLLPQVSESDIKGRSKSDSFAKALACVQVAWIFLQVVERLANHPNRLPVSLLEIHTLGHIVTAILLYAIWWKKPQDVELGIKVPVEQNWPLCALLLLIQNKCVDWDTTTQTYQPNAEFEKCLAETPGMSTVWDLVASAPDEHMPLYEIYEDMRPDYSSHSTPAFATALALNETPTRNDSGHLGTYINVIYSLLYGGVHLAAWNSDDFPSTLERWLWRISAIIITSVFPVFAMYPYIFGVTNLLVRYRWVPLVFLFFPARLYLVIESFISLRHSPIGLYDTPSWTQFVPHL